MAAHPGAARRPRRATLDLTRLCLKQGRAADATAEATKLVSTLGALAHSAEDSAALKALALSAPSMAAVSGDDLDAVERVSMGYAYR